MDLFELGRLLHGSVGIVALISFWVAGLAAKGSRLHRRAGRIYLPAMLAIMALSLLMVAGQAFQQRSAAMAVYILFLISMVGSACWLTWFSIRDKQQPQRLVGRTYRGLATLLIVFGAAVLLVTINLARPIGIFLSLLGMAFGINMWRLALRPPTGRSWYLQHHLNGVMLNFIATHDSFIALGIGSLVPELRHSVPRMMIAVTITAVAIVLRIKYGRPARMIRGAERAAIEA